MRLALIRHPALQIASGICYGRLDVPLANPAEIPAIVSALAGFTPARIVASPAGRCRALAEAIPCTQRLFDPRLLELDFGRWEGKPWDDIDRAELDPWAADPFARAPPGGETGAALIARTSALFDEILASAADHAIVAHAGPLKVLTCLARGVPADLFAASQRFGSVAYYDVEKGNR